MKSQTNVKQTFDLCSVKRGLQASKVTHYNKQIAIMIMDPQIAFRLTTYWIARYTGPVTSRKLTKSKIYRFRSACANCASWSDSILFSIKAPPFTEVPICFHWAPPGGLSGERVGLMTWWLWVRSAVEATFLSGVCSPLTSAEACEKCSRWLWEEK